MEDDGLTLGELLMGSSPTREQLAMAEETDDLRTTATAVTLIEFQLASAEERVLIILARGQLHDPYHEVLVAVVHALKELGLQEEADRVEKEKTLKLDWLTNQRACEALKIDGADPQKLRAVAAAALRQFTAKVESRWWTVRARVRPCTNGLPTAPGWLEEWRDAVS